MTKSPHPSSVDKGELLPCPFCGGEPKFCPDDSYGHCGIGCGCDAEPFVQARKDEPEKAITAWNTRNQSHSLPGDVGMREATQSYLCPTPWCSREDAPHIWQGVNDKYYVTCPSCGVNGPDADDETDAWDKWCWRGVDDKPKPVNPVKFVNDLLRAELLAAGATDYAKLVDEPKSLWWMPIVRKAMLAALTPSTLSGDAGEGLAAIATERTRQIEVEGWSTEHDDEHADCQMAGAAACYAMSAIPHWAKHEAIRLLWPWSKDWWKPRSHRENLVRAGALIVAEIERIDRAALPSQQGTEP